MSEAWGRMQVNNNAIIEFAIPLDNLSKLTQDQIVNF